MFVAIYTYRDLYPLATFNGTVLDAEEGLFLWLKITTLTLAAIVIPLVTPRYLYPPTVDQLTSDSTVNPEETASLLSLLTHSYLDSFIFRMHRSSVRLTADGLPPLSEADHSDVLMPDILAILDPPAMNPPYLFWGLLKAYKMRICMVTLLHLSQTALSYVAPFGIKQILSYLENNGEGATIRPWVFVSLLFLGPFFRAIFSQMVTYMTCRNQGPNKRNFKPTSPSARSKINNLATSDVSDVAGVADLWVILLCFPFDLGLSLWFLYGVLGYSAFVGFGFMLLCVPIPGYITQLLRGIQISRKQKTDARVQSVTEALGVIRMAKLFGWEIRLQSQIASKRAEELAFVKKSKLYSLLNTHTNLLIPMCTMMITYTIYTVVLKKELTSSVVFSSMAVFDILRDRIRAIAITIPNVVQGKVAFDRLDDFLKKANHFSQQQFSLAPSDSSVVGFRDAEFQWLGSSEHGFKLKLKGEVLFRQNCINLILGPTGAGKTSLLLALLGEMRFSPAGQNSYCNLPRQGGVSYAAQESWIQNDTIKNNILFGSEFDKERYESVLHQCALLRDLTLFEAGDMTEVGEKGLTLSGGQKARVTLARAGVFIRSAFVLLDDPLSALDVHTAKWIVDKCLKGPLMKGTNSPSWFAISEYSIAIAFGRNYYSRSTAQLAEEEKALESELIDEPPILAAQKEPTKSHGGLVVAEEMQIGHISWGAFKLYLGSLNRWLDTTPTSRILTRATVDVGSIDDSLAFGFWRLSEISILLLVSVDSDFMVRLGSVVVFSPIFLIPGVAIALLGGYIGQVYLGAQLPLRRLMSVTKAPILGHFNVAVAGLVSIRAYGAENAFLKESRVRIDAWFRPSIPSYNVNRWIAIRADSLAGIFTAGLGAYLVYGHSGTSAANTGFSMTMAVGFTSFILTWVRLFNATELEANSLERLQHYLNIEHEEKGSLERVPPAYWPASGALEVEGLCAKDGPEVLHSLTFTARSGERIGIVGRTGSGKSSLTLALLRAIPTSGQVLYDGVPTHRVNLDVTPPELLSGTLRQNLDPFSEHDDSRLNDALRSAGLFSLQGGDAQNKLGLDSEIGGGGNNLSVGQRQIIALARAIVRGSKLLILDEATSSIDHKTDAIIQESLRHELGDATLITVAHRLATIMDFDRIMVLDEGRIVEFDSPKSLLEKGGMFRALVDESADRAQLYALVDSA
ncbi:P-loop containing nucleoside triphosphate hydrolase protein [Gymnopus androsaceus JB14]|uniref:P-loop containing nucleoside triphosphate hydrolase protein n=1 Tax=Gymnopus androsaceus JB14 TaxID=1447944 RepID=A0A6A4I1X7_9AGAR|nr:P-loop containing nucleoside triphosphate hydrolase protein [Gymnopus androsaceus JB14]